MFFPVQGQLWLRRSIRFDSYFTSENGDGAAWLMTVFPSMFSPSQIVRYPASLTYFCLSGRGHFEIEGGEKFVIGPMSTLRVPANTRHVLKNELRDDWKLWVVMNGNTGAENFLCSLGETAVERELLEEAKAYGLELFFPEIEPEKTDPIRVAENRISYPQNLGFSL